MQRDPFVRYCEGKRGAVKKLKRFCAHIDECDCNACRTTYKWYGEDPPCNTKCLPELFEENVLVYEVYIRVFNVMENDPFKIMELLGVDEKIYCLDLIQAARGHVLRERIAREKSHG